MELYIKTNTTGYDSIKCGDSLVCEHYKNGKVIVFEKEYAPILEKYGKVDKHYDNKTRKDTWWSNLTGNDWDEFYNDLSKQDFVHTPRNSEQYQLTITANSFDPSNENKFNINNLHDGDYYKPVKAYYIKPDGGELYREYNKGEYSISNQTLPRLAIQIFEDKLLKLTDEEKEDFPICQYKPNEETIKGIYNNVDEFRKTWAKRFQEFMEYQRGSSSTIVIYCWNIFSTIYFVQECLKRWEPNGKFVLVYRDKTPEELKTDSERRKQNKDMETNNYQTKENENVKKYSKKLYESKNIIFRGAPGTGKSYLAKQVATDIVSAGKTQNYDDLTEEQKKQIEFVQFHPSYDYTDFVEGLRPYTSEDDTVGFKLQDGTFKKFVSVARKNFEDSLKDSKTLKKEIIAEDAINKFLSSEDLQSKEFETVARGSKFHISDFDEEAIEIYKNSTSKELSLRISRLTEMLESGNNFSNRDDVGKFFNVKYRNQSLTYYLALFKEIIKYKDDNVKTVSEEQKKYVFIIDEINRGEISKIFGELFFSIDPGYRGESGKVSTQYQNLHENPNDKFYIPDNVYIIGTMNDIDRSVDTFDFAMRRRFRFIEIKPEDNLGMLDQLSNQNIKNEAIKRMNSLNKQICETDGLNENYQIGASYFLKLEDIDFDELWSDYLEPLLEEYVRGLADEEELIKKFKDAYNLKNNDSQDN